MAIQIIDNLLKEEDFMVIKNALMGDEIPWFYNYGVANTKDDGFYFTHRFFNKEVGKTPGYQVISKLLEKLKCNNLIRAKANLYIGTVKSKKHDYHADFDSKHKGCLLYINTNNGYNYFEEGNKKIKPEANRAVFFDPSVKHCSSTCTDSSRRITININYL